MEAIRSICIQCGQAKRQAVARCSACGFEPCSPRDKARSLILSSVYEIDGDLRGKSPDELLRAGRTIQSGQPYVFDAAEVDELVEYAERVLGAPGRGLAIDALRWLLPPLLLLGGLYALIYLTS